MNFPNDFKTAFTSYLFVVTPFLILIVVKALTGKFEDILITGDWAIASAMMFSTSYFTVKNALSYYKGDLDKTGLDLYLTFTLVLAFISLTVYVIMLMHPKNYAAAIVQVILFFVATRNYIKYSRLAYRLKDGI